ncbi:putative Bromodomain testis-specific protein [Xylariaceae sp. FL0255]|nr:putative Bromodomain testis-specific protein [Xylariaceae sp. FL0255]
MATEEGPVDSGQAPAPFSWLDPHPDFCILIVGDDDSVFGLHRDLLSAKSTWFRKYFANKQAEKQALGGGEVKDTVELVLKLPDVNPVVFGLAQHFLHTGTILPEGQPIPSYDLLIDSWMLGHEYGITGLCDEALDGMQRNRAVSNHIPSTELLIRAWKEVPEGSSLRNLLLSWTAEYIRLSENRAEFTKKLPQEFLSELVVAISDQNTLPVAQAGTSSPPPPSHKNVHYIDEEENEPQQDNNWRVVVKKQKKPRQSDARPSKTKPRPSLSNVSRKPSGTKRPGFAIGDDGQFAEQHKLAFCSNLLDRMLSGPGFWTRVVGPFKEPVRPVEDGVPDYLDKVKRPMDLDTIKRKMDTGCYETASQFEADVKQIYENCFAYWGRDHDMSVAADRFQKHFEEKYAEMFKWLSKHSEGAPEGEAAQ